MLVKTISYLRVAPNYDVLQIQNSDQKCGKVIMSTKILFFDTCAIIKYFVKEKGSDVIRWLCENETKYLLSLLLCTSQEVRNEFTSAIRKKAERGEVDKRGVNGIIQRAESYFEQFFDICDDGPMPNLNSDKNVNSDEILLKYKFLDKKDDGDIKIIMCVINYLRIFSEIHIITSDKKFQKVIKGENYSFIDPEKKSIEDLNNYLA